MPAPNFIHDDFLLQSDAARELYHRYAKDEPIYDYHCHLPPDEVAADRRFTDLYDIWLRGDHYKWRAMRSNGVPERLCTGPASAKEKFLAWAATVPHTLRNPLYHWSHLELKRYFGIDTLLSPATAEAIWEEANAQLAAPGFSARGILQKFRVAVVCTTDDPADPLEHHLAIARSGLRTRVYPTFRPDKALTVDNPAVFGPWCDRLAAAANIDTGTFRGLLAALKKRHDDFHALGGRLSDHGLERCHASFGTEAEAAAIFDAARAGRAAAPDDKEKFATHLMVYFGQLDAARGWTKQIHLGAMRNNNTRLFGLAGPDIGCDSVGDYPQGLALSRYLDRLDRDGTLPKVVLYNLNPADNYLFATMIGNFQDGSVPGKIQFGSGWWFLDQKEAMEWQLNALSNLGLLSRFVGMLTDSRSFLSYPRHEYFRRVLCNLLGADLERGELPRDFDLVGDLVRRVCFANARDYFGLESGVV
jgi:glucuronate isomerase